MDSIKENCRVNRIPSVSNTHNVSYYSSSTSSNITDTNGHDCVPIPNQEFSEGIEWARIRDALKWPYSFQKERLIYSLHGFILKSMTDKQMQSVFQAFLEACKTKHFDPLLQMVWWESESFIEVAFCRQGVFSMIKLVRKLKKSCHAFAMTGILSTRFVEIMTDHHASQVIQTCFIHFSHEPNEILYESAIKNCHYLAVHKVGCRSLNDCISTISGEQRSRLLNSIADIADILCDDRYGNYVLQNVLKFNRDDEVNSRIFRRLRGQFVQLALRKVGSHTVEKCMEISETWLLCVVEEILCFNQAPRALAQDHFGNYVVQKALRMTKEHGFASLYTCLVHALKPHIAALSGTSGGRNVVAAIKEGGFK